MSVKNALLAGFTATVVGAVVGVSVSSLYTYAFEDDDDDNSVDEVPGYRPKALTDEEKAHYFDLLFEEIDVNCAAKPVSEPPAIKPPAGDDIKITSAPIRKSKKAKRR